ncbi:hypothetical protein [Haloprofundus salilacus]|uniref:hypothetical protein n=1 Tax=Haloprofundus salilacus TaxID=2876190 RepID=UPI001CCDCD1E|nr:hypothetical protein [Haloprofundus salilacus]
MAPSEQDSSDGADSSLGSLDETSTNGDTRSVKSADSDGDSDGVTVGDGDT